MARERMVTRTVTTTTCEVMCVNVTTAEVQVKDYTLTGEQTKETALKQLKKLYETETEKIVNVNAVSLNETLYGMTELDFIKLAKVLPPRTKSDQE